MTPAPSSAKLAIIEDQMMIETMDRPAKVT